MTGTLYLGHTTSAADNKMLSYSAAGAMQSEEGKAVHETLTSQGRRRRCDRSGGVIEGGKGWER